MTEVRRGYRTPVPEGKYVTRTWTEAPPEPHIIRYERIRHGYHGIVTRVHNPETGLFEVRRSPLQSSAVSPVPGLYGTSRDIKPTLSKARTDYKHQCSTNTETPHIPSSTHLPKTSQITDSTSSKDPSKSSKITLGIFELYG